MRRSLRVRRVPKGFTLMEVLLVLVILVLLGGTASVFFINIQKNAYMDTARTQINSFKQALDLYRMDVGSYPSEQDGLQALLVPPTNAANPSKWRGPYLKDAIPNDPWDNPYIYRVIDANTIQIISLGPDRMEGTADDIVG